MTDYETSNDVYDFIRDFFAEYGYSPTLREIAVACYMSTTTVVRYLDKLCADGRISRELQKPRSIALQAAQREREFATPTRH